MNGNGKETGPSGCAKAAGTVALGCIGIVVAVGVWAAMVAVAIVVFQAMGGHVR